LSAVAITRITKPKPKTGFGLPTTENWFWTKKPGLPISSMHGRGACYTSLWSMTYLLRHDQLYDGNDGAGVKVSEVWHRGSNAHSVRSLAVNKEMMRLETRFCSSFYEIYAIFMATNGQTDIQTR